MRICAAASVRVLLSCAAWAQQPAPPPTPSDKASHFSAADLSAALAKLPTDRPNSSVRIFTLTPCNVNVERRQLVPQGASLHEANAKVFYVIGGAATILTGGKLVGETQNRTNLRGKSIDGGVPQKLGKGDFIIVPSGTPHQFIYVEGNITIMSLSLPNAK